MARSRLLKPGFFLNEDLAALPAHARLLFAGLWTIADREGRLEDRPARIRAELFPYESVDVNSLLDELAGAGFVMRYAIDGRRYITIPAFGDHQSPHVREAASQIPAPPEQAPDKHQTSTGLAPGSASPRRPVSVSDPVSVSVPVTGFKSVSNPVLDPETVSGARASRVAEMDERHVQIAIDAITEHATETSEEDELIDIVQYHARTQDRIDLTRAAAIAAIQAALARLRPGQRRKWRAS